MAFDPSKYKPKGIKKLPVLLLLDVSGSMSGNKIIELHDAVTEMINSYVELKKRERVIEVSIITFGHSVSLYTKYTPVDDLQKTGIPQFTANGGTQAATKVGGDPLTIADIPGTGVYEFYYDRESSTLQLLGTAAAATATTQG